jgi:hypothetical protein
MCCLVVTTTLVHVGRFLLPIILCAISLAHIIILCHNIVSTITSHVVSLSCIIRDVKLYVEKVITVDSMCLVGVKATMIYVMFRKIPVHKNPNRHLIFNI